MRLNILTTRVPNLDLPPYYPSLVEKNQPELTDKLGRQILAEKHQYHSPLLQCPFLSTALCKSVAGRFGNLSRLPGTIYLLGVML